MQSETKIETYMAAISYARFLSNTDYRGER